MTTFFVTLIVQNAFNALLAIDSVNKAIENIYETIGKIKSLLNQTKQLLKKLKHQQLKNEIR